MANAGTVKHEQREHRPIGEPIVPVVADEVRVRATAVGKRLPGANNSKHWR